MTYSIDMEFNILVSAVPKSQCNDSIENDSCLIFLNLFIIGITKHSVSSVHKSNRVFSTGILSSLLVAQNNRSSSRWEIQETVPNERATIIFDM